MGLKALDLAARQQREGEAGGTVLPDGKTVAVLLRQRVGAEEVGFKGASDKVVWENAMRVSAMKGWGAPDMRGYGQGAWVHALLGAMLTCAAWCTWRDAQPGRAGARERGSCGAENEATQLRMGCAEGRGSVG